MKIRSYYFCYTCNYDIDYMEYIVNIKNNELATKVKIADLKHNSDLNRLNIVTQKDLDRIKKYENALEILQNK